MKKVFVITAVILAFAGPSCLSFAAQQAKKEVKKGNLLYNESKFTEALKEYEEALLKIPDSDVVNFNLGAALYKTEDYKAAMQHFEKALVSDEKALEENASYNLGNSEYKHGISLENTNIEEAIGLLKRSLAHYENAILLDDEDEDAKFNREFVKKELERLLKKKEEEKKEEKREEGEEKKEDKEKEGEDKREIQKEESERKEAKYEMSEGEMAEKEAGMLLEQYRNEEEPRGLYKGKIPTAGFPEVLKDW